MADDPAHKMPPRDVDEENVRVGCGINASAFGAVLLVASLVMLAVLR